MSKVTVLRSRARRLACPTTGGAFLAALSHLEGHFRVPHEAFSSKQAGLFLYDLFAEPPSCRVSHRRVRGSGIPAFDAKMDELVELAVSSIGPLEPREGACGRGRSAVSSGAVRLGLALVVLLGDDPEFSGVSKALGEFIHAQPSKDGKSVEFLFDVMPVVKRLFD